MRTWMILCLLPLLNAAYGQNIIPVSSTGIGYIKVNMTLAQVEKTFGQAIALPTSHEESNAFDSVQVNYKGIMIDPAFYSTGNDENGKPKKMVYGIGASHQSLQNRSCFKTPC